MISPKIKIYFSLVPLASFFDYYVKRKFCTCKEFAGQEMLCFFPSRRYLQSEIKKNAIFRMLLHLYTLRIGSSTQLIPQNFHNHKILVDNQTQFHPKLSAGFFSSRCLSTVTYLKNVTGKTYFEIRSSHWEFSRNFGTV